MSTTLTIVGIPVHMERQGGHTIIRPQMRRDFSAIQTRLVAGWLQHKGNVVVDQGDHITVPGDLKPGSVCARDTTRS
jgi:hypothetical protein